MKTECEMIVDSDRIFTAYDVCRLRAYRAIPGNPNAIRLRRFGRATAMQFPAVGYFNRVDGFGERTAARLPEILDFYAAANLPFEVTLRPGSPQNGVVAALREAGLRPYKRRALVQGPPEPPPAGRRDDRLRIVPVTHRNLDRFLDTYLDAFEVDAAKRPEAKKTMRQLRGIPGLHLRLGEIDDQPAAIGVLFCRAGIGYLAGGATRRAFRRRGCQAALLRERLAMARDLGCHRVVSWAAAGGASARNLLRAGQDLESMDTSWFADIRDAAPDPAGPTR